LTQPGSHVSKIQKIKRCFVVVVVVDNDIVVIVDGGGDVMW
jgi:hypothetical protein